MKLKPLQDSIFFSFVQNTKHGFFRESTDWGFSLDNIVDYDSLKSRWGLVEDVGPDVSQVKIGDYILIDAGKWTNAIEVEGKKVWRTKEDYVQLTSDAQPDIH